MILNGEMNINQKKKKMIDDFNLKQAQAELYQAGKKELISVGLRLKGTEFENNYKKVYNAVRILNTKLIREIQRREKEKRPKPRIRRARKVL